MVSPHTRVYVNGVLEIEGFPLEEVSDHLERPDTVVWVDFTDPTRDQLQEVAKELGLHELAVEDAVGPLQRPKLDYYETHLFLSCHAVRVDLERGELEDTEVDAFINERWLITVCKNAKWSTDQVAATADRFPDLAANGVSFLVYAVLDQIVDGYFSVIQDFEGYYESLSGSLFAEPLEPAQQEHSFRIRQAMSQFHRLVVPLGEAVRGLTQREHAIVSREFYPYYQNVYDHLLRVQGASEVLREMVSAIVETNLSLRSYRQNRITEQVTSWAAIIAVPTLITGYYGMNVPYPGSEQISGVLVSSGLIVLLSATLYLVFRKRGWL